jgi:hypothetical protein
MVRFQVSIFASQEEGIGWDAATAGAATGSIRAGMPWGTVAEARWAACPEDSSSATPIPAVFAEIGFRHGLLFLGQIPHRRSGADGAGHGGSGDQPGTAAECEILKAPLNEYQNPALELHQVHEVNE